MMAENITRRHLLKAAPAAIALPAAASETPVAALFREWRDAATAYAAASIEEVAAPAPDGRRVEDVMLDRIRAAEEMIAGMPPQSVVDFALKLIVADGGEDGEGRPSTETLHLHSLVREAYSIAGVEGWTDVDEAHHTAWLDMVDPQRRAHHTAPGAS